MDKLNEKWLKGEVNFYFKYKRKLLESMIEGTCLNIGCGSHLIESAVNIDEGLPNIPYPDNSFDTVICSDVIEHIGPHKQAQRELLRVAKRKVIITVPAYPCLFGEYDRLMGHKRRYKINDFPDYQVEYLFWFLVPIICLRKIFKLKHKPLPLFWDRLFYKLSHFHFNYGTTILATKYKFKIENLKERISVFIPVFNEEKIINRDIKLVDLLISKIPIKYEIFIVNDASRDKTKAIAKKIEKTNRNVTLLNYRLGPTRRENLAQAFKKASGEIIVFVDIDIISSLRFLPDLIENILNGYDIVTGSRYARGAKIRRKPFRYFISKIYNFLIRLFFKTRILDHMCGFKAFKRSVILDLVDRLGYDQALKRGIFWDTELIIRAQKRGYKIKEIPIWWNERNKTALNFQREAKAIGYIITFFLKNLGR